MLSSNENRTWRWPPWRWASCSQRLQGLSIYVSATAAPLHPSEQSVQSVTRANPSPTWTNAVERARQIARASLTAQNLPGLSVAVGVGGEIVRAEGFGWAELETHAPVAPEMQFRTGRSPWRSPRSSSASCWRKNA